MQKQKLENHRIGYFIDSFPLVSETFILNEIQEVSRKGGDVRIFSLNRPEKQINHPGAKDWAEKTNYLGSLLPQGPINPLTYLKYGREIGIIFRSIVLSRRLPPPYDWIARKAGIIAVQVKALGCTRLHAHFAGPAAQWAFVVSRLLGIPFSFTAHAYDIYKKPPEYFDLLIESADVCATVSEYNRSFLIEKFGDPARKFKVITCGTDTTFFRPPPVENRVNGRILTVGRLVPEKGYEFIIQAASILRDRGVEFSWKVIGEGPERANIEESIRIHKLEDSVSLLGARTSTEVREAMLAAQLFVLGSVSEAVGTVYIEAMATETAVIGTKVMGVAEFVIENTTGFLVPPRDPHALAQKIEELLKDEPTRRRIGSAGRAHVLKNLDLEGQVDKLLNLWAGAKKPGD